MELINKYRKELRQACITCKVDELYAFDSVLTITGSDDILGVISIERIPEEWRIHIRLLTVSKENKGRDKNYENITGNLITYVSKIALKEYAELACVSLKSKGAIAQHYIDKYGMNITGATLSVELREILNLLKEYDHG